MKKIVNKVTQSRKILDRIKKQYASYQSGINKLGSTIMDQIWSGEKLLNEGQLKKASNVTLIVTISLKK